MQGTTLALRSRDEKCPRLDDRTSPARKRPHHRRRARSIQLKVELQKAILLLSIGKLTQHNKNKITKNAELTRTRQFSTAPTLTCIDQMQENKSDSEESNNKAEKVIDGYEGEETGKITAILTGIFDEMKDLKNGMKNNFRKGIKKTSMSLGKPVAGREKRNSLKTRRTRE